MFKWSRSSKELFKNPNLTSIASASSLESLARNWGDSMMTSLLDNCFQLQIWICCDFNLLRKPGFSNLPRQLQRIETCGPLSSFHWHADLLVFHQPPPPLYLKKTGNNSSQNLTTKFYVSNVASSLSIRKQKPIKRLLSVNKHLLEVDVCSIN